MPKEDTNTRLSLFMRLEKLESTLFGGKLEDQFAKNSGETTPLFSDKLEKTVFLILLDLSLEGKIGATSALIAEMTEKTKNTANVRLERLYYKRLIQKQQIGNALLYYVPINELLLGAVTKELIDLKKTQLDDSSESSEEELKKDILSKYLTNIDLILGRSKEYFESVSSKVDTFTLNLKRELIE